MRQRQGQASSHRAVGRGCRYLVLLSQEPWRQNWALSTTQALLFAAKGDSLAKAAPPRSPWQQQRHQATLSAPGAAAANLGRLPPPRVDRLAAPLMSPSCPALDPTWR